MNQLPRLVQSFLDAVREYNAIFQLEHGRPLCCLTRTYGCQQNENDTEKLNGMLQEMGFLFTDYPEEADLILFNTCAVREHAEQKVYGHLGALMPLKRRNSALKIALCGCMVQQEQAAEEIFRKYRQVDLVFGPHAMERFPENLYRVLTGNKRVFDLKPGTGNLTEGLPIRREDKIRAWVTVMSGCNNFCTYCIVPYVRGREKSRSPTEVFREVERLIRQGYKDITLLGQNVNSYCKDRRDGCDFADLLRQINQMDGDYRIRFMTSHPKDASEKLFDTIAECEHIAKHIHLPFQSGSDRILERMNRRYTREQYLEKIAYARRNIPGVTFTSDVIVGFPSETEEDFQQTLSLIEEVGFDGLYTFLYSPRTGTPAAAMEDQILPEIQKERFARLTDLQTRLSLLRNEEYLGRTVPVLILGPDPKQPGGLTGRTDGNKIVQISDCSAPAGFWVPVRIEKASNWALCGSAVKNWNESKGGNKYES